MSDSTGAAGIVRNKFETAQNYANDAWVSAISFLDRLGGVAKLAYPHVDLPDLPDLPEYSGVPCAPQLKEVALKEAEAPAVPAFSSLVLDGMEVPRFTVAPPEIVLPDVPAMDLPQAPGDIPNIPDIAVPADPAIVLPDPPVFDPVAIPELPGPLTPTFEGERPPMPDLVVPGNLFVAPPQETYTSSLRTALTERLAGALARGGAGHGVELEQALWDRARRRMEDALAVRLTEIAEGFAARGCAALSGPMAVLLRQAHADCAEALAAHNLDILTKQADLAVQSDRTTVEQTLALEAQNIELFNQSAARAFEAAKALAQYGYEALHAEVAIHNAQLARYQADAAVFEARIRASLADLEAYKLRFEGARLVGEAQKRAADLYVAQLSGASALIDLYKARMEGASAKAALGRDRLHAYETQVQAYVAAVNANTSRFNAYASAVAGQEAKARIYAEQVKAYGGQVAAAKAAAETTLAVSTQENQVKLEAYKADVSRFEAALRQSQAEAEILLKDKELALRGYETDLNARETDATIRSKDHEGTG